MKKKLVHVFAVSMLFAMGSVAAWADEVNCETADQDIKRLEHEKLNTAERMAKGVTSIMPIGLVTKTVKGTEDDDMKMASGDYNDRIDRSIAAIKDACNLN